MTDRIMRLLGTAVAGYAGLTSRSRTRRVRPVERNLALRVSDADLLASDVIGLTLVAASGHELPQWTPGAHIDLVLPSGRLRQYSLCGDPSDRSTYRIAVRRIDTGGGGSLEVHSLPPGTPVTVRGPRNAFPFAYPHLAHHDIQTVAFIAGGIGITALLPMVREAQAADVPWTLTYVGRDAACMPFHDQLATSDHVRILYGAPPIADVLEAVDLTTSVYFCGPPPFLDAVRANLDHRPHAGFHFERFVAPPVVGGKPFTVHLRDIDINVPADRSALAAIRDVVPDVPYSCRQGFCGTCRVGVLSGTVTPRGTATFLHRPDTMLICVDRSDDDITLDLSTTQPTSEAS